MRLAGAVGDSHAADARYHDDCRRKFISKRNVESSSKESVEQVDNACNNSNNQTLHLFENFSPYWTLIPILTLLPNFGGFHRTMQRVRLANRGRLLLRTPGPVPFGTCICSNVETILSCTCHVYGPFEFRTSLGTTILLWCHCPWDNVR